MEGEPEELPWRVERGLQLRSDAQASFRAAMDAANPSVDDREASARQALTLEASALNWLEDSQWEEAIHDELHMMGRLTHARFPAGCHLEWTGGKYEHRCPVRIAHKRFGFSPSFRVAKKVCLICGGDASECPHLPSRLYPVVASRDDNDECTICRQSGCEHEAGIEYMTRMTVEVREVLAMDHIAIVPRPVQPVARLTGIPVDTASLVEVLGAEFRPGMEVHCSLCELPCDGFDRMDSDPRLHGRELPPQRAFERSE
jgi:hypothetical protein